MMKRIGAALAAVALLGSAHAFAHDWATGHAKVEKDDMVATMFKSPACGCCGSYAKHLERAGFDVEVKDVDNMGPIKQLANIPGELESCHTVVIDMGADRVLGVHETVADLGPRDGRPPLGDDRR